MLKTGDKIYRYQQGYWDELTTKKPKFKGYTIEKVLGCFVSKDGESYVETKNAIILSRFINGEGVS